MSNRDCVFCDLTRFRAAEVCIEPLADRGGRSAIRVPENRRLDPWRPGDGRAQFFGPGNR